MADIGPPTALYPQPVAPQQSALSSNPMQMIGALNQLNLLKQFQARQSVGEAAQEAIGPDGSMDPAAFMSGIKARGPQAAVAAPEAISGALDMQGKQIANGTALFGQKAAQSNFVMNGLAGLAGKGSVSDDDLNNFAVNVARSTGIPSAIINGWTAGLPKDPVARANAIRTIQVTAAGAGAGAAPTAGPPIQTGQNAGAPTAVPQAQITQAGGTPTGMGVQGPTILADRAEYQGDQTRSATTLQNLRPLQQALPLIQQMSHWNFGPGSADLAKAKSLAGMIGATNIDPTDQVALRQEAGKYLLRYAAGAQAAGRSDAALSTAIGSNPNPETMVQPAVLSLMKNQIGIDRQDAALPQAGAASAAANNYKGFKTGYFSQTDPKGFAVDLMTPEERNTYIKSLSPADRARFNRSVHYASQAGFFAPPGAQPPQGQ